MERRHSPPSEVLQRAALIRLVGLDVDGTLTPGGIWVGRAEELREFDVRDGLGIKLLQKMGIVVAVISGKTCEATARRCEGLKIEDVWQGDIRKAPIMKGLLQKYGLRPEEAAFVGDDLPDLPLMLHLGLGLAVADACAEVREAAHWTLSKPGGRGAVREAVELILKAQDKWEDLVGEFRRQTLD
jgi:3-deoxy-D-manno-octulosonate 8-phosphate phosphatase (KDO 8-P phosphatase)